MNLSDIFEYMSQEETINYEKLIFNSLNPKGRVAFWNMMNERNFNNHQRINTTQDIENDRAFFYGDFLVYENN